MKLLVAILLVIGVFVTLPCFVAAQIADNLIFEQVAVLPFRGTPAFASTNSSRAYFYGGALTKSAYFADLATGKVFNSTDGLFNLEGACAVINSVNDIFVMGGDQLGDGSGTAAFQYLQTGADGFTTASGMLQTRQYHRCVYEPVKDLIYSLGGYLQSPSWITLITMDYYKPGIGWSVAPYPISNPVTGFAFILDNSQTLYILGGTNESNVPVDYIQVFNQDTSVFSRLQDTLAIPHSNMGAVLVPEFNMIILCGGDEANCQYFQPGSTPKTGVITTNLQPSNLTFAHVIGPNLYLVQKTGQILVAKCALALCPHGCIDGVCADAPTPVSVAPFSGCGQCTGDTALCVPERGVCVGNRVVPILQCIDTLDNGKKRSHFAYNNLAPVTVNIASNTANNFIAPSGTPIDSFTPGRSYYYPLDAFTIDSTPNTVVTWFVDGYLISFNTSDTSLVCPDNATFGIKVSPVPSDVQAFLDRLRQALASVLGVLATRFQAELVTQKRQSNLEAEIEVTVSSSGDSTEPSPAEIVSNFVTNQTAVQKVQEQVPEVQTITPPKPLPTELSGQVVPGAPTVAPVAPKVPITASSSVKITERIFLPMNVLWICLFSVLYVWIQFG